MANVSLRKIHKSYGDVEVIHGIDLDIVDGEFVVLVGPSGCGKSTLLRMIAGLETVTAGDITIGERTVNNVEPKDRDIAMVFQNYALYPHMKVYDNMAYGLRNRGMDKAAIDERVRRASAILKLDEFLDRRPRQLSGGQRQRVAMGRAIVREPSVFLFDEPLSNLDAKLRVEMRVEIRKLHARLGVTSVYVTHDQVEAMTLADRLVVMNQGVAEQVGQPIELYRRPATTFVAAFIGSPSMNFLPGRLDDDGGSVVLPDGQVLALPEGGHKGRGGSPVTLGIRPEHLRHATADGADTFTLRVEVAERLGPDTLVHGSVGNENLVARLPGTMDIASGDSIRLDAGADSLHLFDPESGRRLQNP